MSGSVREFLREWKMKSNVCLENMGKIGSGSYGSVYMMRDKSNDTLIALKKVSPKEDDEGINSTTIREISIMKELRHPNIVNLIESHIFNSNVFMVMEYIKNDLHSLMGRFKQNKMNMPISLIRNMAYQMLQGLCYLHSRGILHRDIKPLNILVEEETCNVKFCDFGLSRVTRVPVPELTREVVTVWYRCPELLLGCPLYSTPLDIWSLGCIFAEMILLRPLFDGDTEIGTLFKIFQLLGTPDNTIWNGVEQFRNLPPPKFPKWKGNHLCYQLRECQDLLFVDLITKMIVYDPSLRISAKTALRHPFFKPIHQIQREMFGKKNKFGNKRRNNGPPPIIKTDSPMEQPTAASTQSIPQNFNMMSNNNTNTNTFLPPTGDEPQNRDRQSQRRGLQIEEEEEEEEEQEYDDFVRDLFEY